MRHFLVILVAFLVFFPIQAVAQEREGFDDRGFMSGVRQEMGMPIMGDGADLAANNEFGGGGGQDIILLISRIVFGLLLVLALIAATAWGIRKTGLFSQSGIDAAVQTPSMSVLEALATGQNGVILLVRCEEQVFLVGQTQAKYTLLQELNENTAKKIIESKVKSDSVSSFKSSLANFMQNIKVQSASSSSVGQKI